MAEKEGLLTPGDGIQPRPQMTKLGVTESMETLESLEEGMGPSLTSPMGH